MKTFIELGAGRHPKWGIEKLQEGGLVYFIEANPTNFINMYKVINTLDENLIKNARFILGCISDEDSLKTFEIENIEKSTHTKTFLTSENTPFKTAHSKEHAKFTIFMTSVSFSKLLKTIREVDTVLIDVEGAEIALLETWDFEVLPKKLIIEIHNPATENWIIAHLEKHYNWADVQPNPDSKAIINHSHHYYFDKRVPGFSNANND